MRVNYVIAFLLGVIAALLGLLLFGHGGPAPAFAQTVDGVGGFIAGTANYGEQGGRNQIWILNAAEKGAPKLCLYEANAGQFKLMYARNIAYDFMYDQYPGREDAQQPTVREVIRETKAKRDEERKSQAAPAGDKKDEKSK